MINPIHISRDVVVVQDGVPVSGGAVSESIPVDRINQDSSLPGRQGTNADSVDIQGLYGVLSTSKDAVNRVATEIRGLGEAKSLVARVRDSLELIVKNFPPFPPGSLEREQFLNSVAGIRAMIERLSFPSTQGEAISKTFSDVAFVNAEASDQDLSAGLDHIWALEEDLGAAQSKLSDAIQVRNINSRTEDAYFIEQSQSLGQVLLVGKLSIGQESRLIHGMLN
jgi:hypothetical protein